MIIWLASYPRSGNTFFRVILNSVFDIKTYSLYDDRGDIGADKETSAVVGHEFLPENFSIQKARDDEKIYYIKTHELLDNRVDKNDKVIYLIRDGRESTLSFTKHQNTFGNDTLQIIDTIYGKTFIGSWGGHIKSWGPKDRENTLLIKFETLVKEPTEYIKKLSDFLQIQPVGNKIPTFDALKKINPNFFRSGKINSWEDVFSEEEHMSFWLKNYQMMIEYGYDYKKIDINNTIKNKRLILENIHQNNYLMNTILTDNRNNKYLVQSIHKNNRLILENIQQNNNLMNTILTEHKKLHDDAIKTLNHAQTELEKRLKLVEKELNTIYTSRKWKFAQSLAKIKKFIYPKKS